jgi:hypothetical protein
MKKTAVFPSDKVTPQQALLQVQEEIEDVESICLVYMKKGDDETAPYLTCSSQTPMVLNYMGVAVQHFSMRGLSDG